MEQIRQAMLAGQIALVTGGGRGLGRAFALGLAGAGMSVAVVARTTEQLAETVRLIEAMGGRAYAFSADVSNTQAVIDMVETVQQKLGPIDLLVNSAGVAGPVGPTWVVGIDEWWNCFEVNLRGTFLCCHAVIPSMLERGRGRIINLASAAAKNANPYLSAYVASKTAVIRFTEALAAELRQHGVVVFSIEPGAVKTTMADQLIETQAGRRWLPWVEAIFAQGRNHTVEPGTHLVLFLASGAGDQLSGRFWAVPEDPAQVIGSAEEVKRDDLYTLRLRTLAEMRWQSQTARFLTALRSTVPLGSRLVLIDEMVFDPVLFDSWQTFHFPEIQGEYAGPPANDEQAIAALKQVCQPGGGFLVFAWPCFWWLEYYTGFHRGLREQCRCALENELAIVFELTEEMQEVSV